jgi:hypothetical protein|tara:strand:- start:112 stop:225 length:114 start_codon:yes stop_codon:yes gene_type:complete
MSNCALKEITISISYNPEGIAAKTRLTKKFLKIKEKK